MKTEGGALPNFSAFWTWEIFVANLYNFLQMHYGYWKIEYSLFYVYKILSIYVSSKFMLSN